MGNRIAFKLSITLFVLVWGHLSTLYKKRELFALSWITRSEKALQIFISDVIGANVGRISRGFLLNGYRNCRATALDTYSEATWKRIDSVFLNAETMPKPMKRFRRAIGQNFSSLLEERIRYCATEKTFSKADMYFCRLDVDVITRYLKCFLGIWSEEFLKLVPVDKLKLFKQIPDIYAVVDSGKNKTSIFDKTMNPPVLVAVHFRQKVLTESELQSFRDLLVRTCAGHAKITRGAAKPAFDSHMTAFGPRWDRFKRHGGKKVCFYTAVLKINKLLRECAFSDAAGQYQLLVDKYAHNNVMEVIVALYLWWCPDVLQTFFDYSPPYLAASQHEQCELERDLEGNGPSSYQVYITKDYCSAMHADADITEFSLCYTSHPDAAVGAPRVDFCIPEIGCRLPVGNGDLFAFRSSMIHGTIHRAKTTNAAYTGCLVVNRSVDHLMRRRSTAKKRGVSAKKPRKTISVNRLG